MMMLHEVQLWMSDILRIVFQKGMCVSAC